MLLIENGPITDLFADGLERWEISGPNVRSVYWRWRLVDGGWQRHALDFAIVRPIASLVFPLDFSMVGDARILRVPIDAAH